MDTFYSKKILLAITLLSIVLISSCAPEQAQATCGNNIVEAGEECDGNGCSTSEVCTEKCKCEIPEIPSPPALPE